MLTRLMSFPTGVVFCFFFFFNYTVYLYFYKYFEAGHLREMYPQRLKFLFFLHYLKVDFRSRLFDLRVISKGPDARVFSIMSHLKTAVPYKLSWRNHMLAASGEFWPCLERTVSVLRHELGCVCVFGLGVCIF